MDVVEEKFVTGAEEKERTNEIRVDVDDDVFTRGETKGGGSFDSRSVLQKCALWNDGKNQTSLSLSLSVSRTISNLLFVPLSTTFFLPLLLLLATLLSISYRIFRIWISRKEVERSAPSFFFLSTVRINCNTLRIGLIDRERNEIFRTKKRKRKKGRERERDCKRYRVVFIA